jgi:glycosyl transferase family 2
VNGIVGGFRILRRKVRTFAREVTADGPGRILPRAYARLNKLDFVQFGIRGTIVPFRVRMLREREGAPASSDEVVVFSVVRDGMPWLHTFLAHHRELGARRFVILDNGSNDGSADYLLTQDDVTLLSSTAPYRHYQNTFKRYVCNRFARDRWCLFADVDELLAYPGMERRSLQDLVRFAREGGFTGVVTQMLDMFPDRPIADMPDGAHLDLRPLYRFYETRHIERRPSQWHASNHAPAHIPTHFGGVRRRIFGTDNGLTKVSLFYNGGGLVPFHQWHSTRGARIADFSVALLHYPFDRGYRDRVLEAAANNRHGWVPGDEYHAYAAVMRENPALSLMSEASRLYRGPEQLVAEGFLQASPAFAEWAGLS